MERISRYEAHQGKEYLESYEGFSIIDPSKKKTREFKGWTDEEIICYLMCSVVGWSYRRLSRMIGISPGTVKERVIKGERRKR